MTKYSRGLNISKIVPSQRWHRMRLSNHDRMRKPTGPFFTAFTCAQPLMTPLSARSGKGGRWGHPMFLLSSTIFRDYPIDTRYILYYIIYMDHLSTLLDRFSFSASSFWTCFLICLAPFFVKRCSSNSSFVIFFANFIFFFHRGSPMKDMNMIQLIEQFRDESQCRRALERMKWPDGIKCPRCGSDKISRLTKRDQFDCDSCRYQFSVTAGSIFHDSHLPFGSGFLPSI